MVARNVAEIVADHVRLTVEGIDRMYLNVYVPRLQCTHGAVSFFRERGQPLASSVLMAPMSRGFVSELDRFAARHRLTHIGNAALRTPIAGTENSGPAASVSHSVATIRRVDDPLAVAPAVLRIEEGSSLT